MTNTPLNKDFSAPLKTPINMSSRKAFGNVSNVLSSKQPVNSKAQHKSLLKESLKLAQDLKTGPQLNQKKPIETEVETVCEQNSKFMDEIEVMFPIDEEMMSEVLDPITKDLFAIDEKTIFEMEFDSEMNHCLVRPKNMNLNIDDLF
jgi:hypothetical protein